MDKEVIQICVRCKNRFIIPWIEKVLQNWQPDGKPVVGNNKSSYKSNKPNNWNLKDQRQIDPGLEQQLRENSLGEDTGEDPMDLLKEIRDG